MNARACAIGSILAAAIAATSASAATPPQPVPVNPGGPEMPAATASLSSVKAGAKPVALTVKVHYYMVCGQPGPGTAVVTLPSAASVPSDIAASDVIVNGNPAPGVSVSGHDVSVTLPHRTGITCDVMAPGTLRITLTKAAGLGNPRVSGTYAIRLRHRTQSFTANVDISA